MSEKPTASRIVNNVKAMLSPEFQAQDAFQRFSFETLKLTNTLTFDNLLKNMNEEMNYLEGVRVDINPSLAPEGQVYQTAFVYALALGFFAGVK